MKKDLNNLQKQLSLKEIENKRFKKRYWVEEKDGNVFIHKETPAPCFFNKLCIELFIEYYRNVLKLPFEYIEKADNRVEFISPYLPTAESIGVIPTLDESNKILKRFPVLYNKIDIITKPKYSLEAYVIDENPQNFFVYNGKTYLLDLEEFCFCIYDKDKNNVGREGLAKEYIDKVKNYKPEYSLDKKNQIRENMLIID